MVSSVPVAQAVVAEQVALPVPVLLQVALLAVPQLASWFRPALQVAVALPYLLSRFCRRKNPE